MLHPELYTYSTDHLDPLLVEGDLSKIVREEAEQIYSLKTYTSEYCRKLVEEVEHCGKWVKEYQLENFGPINVGEKLKGKVPCLVRIQDEYREKYFDIKPEDGSHEIENTMPMIFLEGLNDVYRKMVDLHIKPIITKLWPTFEMEIYEQPYFLKYDMKLWRGMATHHDEETIAMNIYLNDEFTGGGTFFPRWKLNTGRRPPGSTILYPGSVTHVHAGVPIKSGTRYLLLGSFF